MSIATEFIDFIVPIQTIRDKYPGGWEQCLKDHQNLIGGRVWYDDHLFRDGAMNPMDIESLVEKWEAKGFEGIVTREGRKCWKDMCVFEMGGATLLCDWIDFDRETRTAFLRGTEPSEIASRSTNNKESP
jgi:hypothetical protein